MMMYLELRVPNSWPSARCFGVARRKRMITLTPADFALVQRRAVCLEQPSPTTWVRLLEAECEHRLHSHRGVIAQLRRPACAALIAVGDIMRPILTYSYAIIWTTTRFFFERRSHESYEEDTQSGSALAE
jgi:hypothetical protein